MVKILLALFATALGLLGLVFVISLLYVGGTIFSWGLAIGLVALGIWLLYKMFLGL